MFNDSILIGIVFSYVSVIVAISLLLYYKKVIKGRIARNVIHLFSGFAIISLFYADNPYYLLIPSSIITLVLFLARKKTPVLKYLYGAIADKNEKTYLQGPVFYSISLNLLIIFSIITGNKIIPLASTLVMTISDPIAAIVGKKYGKHKIYLSYTRTVRSVEGSIAMFVSNILILSVLFNFQSEIIIISFFIAVSELVSISNWDDLILPIVSTILLLLV